MIAYVVVFLAGVALFSNLSVIQRQQSSGASDLSDPTLPVMYIDIGGNKVDRMRGYVQKMDAANMRDGLIPVTTKRSITVSYKAYKNDIRSVSYEVSAPDTGEVVENAKIGHFTADGDYMSATFSLTEPILMNREYPIRFEITTEDETVYYYSRVIQRSDPVTDKYVQFVYNFYEGCMNPSGSSDLNAYLETDNTITNNSYTTVDIKSSLTQVCWGTLNPRIFRKAVPTIKAISGETCTITNDYLISADGDAGTEIYHVWEYYRLRYYNGKMMLLNYNRKALQCYDGSSRAALNANGVVLGVAEKDVQYLSNDTSDTVAFVQDNALWEYNNPAQKLVCVFSFHDTGSGSDERDDSGDYGIRIVRVSEGGGMDFVVYGYMSRGPHEGRSGVSVCHYNAETSTVTERAFVPYNRGFEQLKDDMGRLCYVTPGGNAYFYLQRALYRVDLTTNSTEVILSDINPDCFVSSVTGASIAWMNEMKPDASQTITVMDLNTASQRTVKAAEGTYIKTLGFLNEDILYGVANQSDLVSGVSGNVTFAMNELRIEEFNGTLVKDYRKDGTYITDVSMEPGLAQLTCATKDGSGGYTPAADDNIMNNQQTKSAVTVTLSSSSRQGTTVTLKLPGAVSSLNPSVSGFRLRLGQKDPAAIAYAEKDDYPLYYVYTQGLLQEVCTDPEKAVTDADAGTGIVLNQDSQYIYERGNKQTKTNLNNEDIPSVFLSGEMNADQLQSGAGGDTTVLNLTGCTLDQVLYLVSQGNAVVTRLADGKTAVIVGYDRYNTLLYNFDTGEHYYMGIKDSTKSMEQGGNVFVSYVESPATVKNG